MKITGIRQQVKKPERVSVYVDGKYSFSLSLDELFEQKIKNCDELDQARLRSLQKISADGKLRARALEWVLNRPRAVREFRDYMRRKKAEPEITDKLIEEFQSRGYLDEARFAAWLVELRSAGGKSNRAISVELASRGIDRETIQQTLKSLDSSEEQRLAQVIAKKSKLSRYQSDPQKLMRYLAAQGFSYDLIKSALNSDG